MHLIKDSGFYDPWGIYLCNDYLPWDEYLELEKTFPEFKKVESLHTSFNDGYSAVSVSAFNEKLLLTGKWEEFVKYHISKKYFLRMFNNFGDIWKTWRPELLEKITSEDFTMGHVRSKVDMKDIPKSEHPDIAYEFLFVHDCERMNRDGLHVHIDRYDKLIQSMIYFRHPEDECNDANLQLHHCHQWGNYFPGTIDKKVDYISNRSVTLPFTPTAYHSVSPGDRTGNPHTRKMVNIIFRVRPDLHELER